MTSPFNQDDPRARVFISCGQNIHSDERTTATAIAERLSALGFEPWIAVEAQTLEGIKEHIFERLSNSEYFIFVDFKREQLVNPNGCRGSLFSHQELALASYLGIDVLAFQESGVKLEGLLAFLGGNAIPFGDRKMLPDTVANEIKKRVEAGQWDSHWRNEIVLERGPGQHEDVKSREAGRIRRFFHIAVRNRHRHKAVTNCYVYLDKAINLATSGDIPFRAFELKWEGYRLPYVNIPPEKERRFDAFCIYHDSPTKLEFSHDFSDWSKVIPCIQGAGRYRIKYLVLSSNFPPARGSFILTLSPLIDSTTFV